MTCRCGQGAQGRNTITPIRLIPGRPAELSPSIDERSHCGDGREGVRGTAGILQGPGPAMRYPSGCGAAGGRTQDVGLGMIANKEGRFWPGRQPGDGHFEDARVGLPDSDNVRDPDVLRNLADPDPLDRCVLERRAICHDPPGNAASGQRVEDAPCFGFDCGEAIPDLEAKRRDERIDRTVDLGIMPRDLGEHHVL